MYDLWHTIDESSTKKFNDEYNEFAWSMLATNMII